jgi:hypothetical protein
MSNYVVVDETTNLIVNRIVLYDPAQWQPPAGHLLIEETGEPMDIGGSYVDGVYTPPEQPDQPVMPPIGPSPQSTALYDHENRLRLLEGQPPLSLGDFIAKARQVQYDR